MRKLLEFNLRHSNWVIFFTLVLTILMGYAASGIKVNSELDALMPENEHLRELIEKYDPDNQEENLFLLALETKGELTVEAMQAYKQVIDEVNALTGGFSSDIFSAVTFSKEGTRLAPRALVPGKEAPKNREDLNRFMENMDNDLFSRDIFFSGKGERFNTMFFHPDIKGENIVKPYFEIIKKLDPYFKTYSTGTVFFTDQSSVYLQKDLFTLLILSLIVILALYYIGFRTKRAVFLPMLIVVMGSLWSIGFMTMAGFELTIISIVIPPLVLTIGTSYAIHYLNEYYHEASVDHTDNSWIIDASLHVNKTIIMAGLTTAFGFLSLLFTSMEASRQFGLATSVGILACAFFSLFFLPAALSKMKNPDHRQQTRVREGRFTRSMGNLSDLVYHVRYALIVLFAVIAVAFYIAYPKITHQSDYVSYFPKDAPSVQGLSFVQQHFAGVQRLNLTITAPEGSQSYFLDPENLKTISGLEKTLVSHRDVMKVSSFPSVIRDLNYIMTGDSVIPEKRALMLVMAKYFKALSETVETGVSSIMANEDFSRINLTIMFYNSKNNTFLSESGLRSLMAYIQNESVEQLPSDLTFDLWGFDMAYLDLAENVKKDQLLSTGIAMFLVFIAASVFFRSIVYGLVTLIPLLSGLMLNFIFMVLFKIPLDMTTMMVSSVAVGVGVDDAIHYILQFKRQLLLGGSLKDVFHRCGRISGRPIALTTASLVGGLLVLCFASFKGIVYFGALVSVTLSFAMIGTLIILPAILAVLVKMKIIKTEA